MSSEVVGVEHKAHSQYLQQIEYALQELLSGNWSYRLERVEDVEYGRVFELINTLAEEFGTLVGELAKALKETEEMSKENMEAIDQLNAGMQQIAQPPSK